MLSEGWITYLNQYLNNGGVKMIEMMSQKEIEMEMLENEGLFTIVGDENLLEKTNEDDDLEEIIQELIINYDEFE